MYYRIPHRAAYIAFGVTLLTAIAVFVPAPATAADEPVVAPPAFVTATSYVAQPGYAGPYNIPQAYFVSISDPDPFRIFGCATNDASCAPPPPAATPASVP